MAVLARGPSVVIFSKGQQLQECVLEIEIANVCDEGQYSVTPLDFELHPNAVE